MVNTNPNPAPRVVTDSEAAALSNEVAELKRELARVTSLIGDIASNKAAKVRNQAANLADDVLTKGEELRDEAYARASALEEELQSAVRDRPLTAVAVAAGVGYLIGLMSRSRR